MKFEQAEFSQHINSHLHNESVTCYDYSQIDFDDYINDLMKTINVFGAGVALFKAGKLEVVSGSSAKVCRINPTDFYTQQTCDNIRPTEMMMPFGLLDSHKQPSFEDFDLHYYYGYPLVVEGGVCVGCIFIFNTSFTSLTEQAKLSIKFVAQLLEAKIGLVRSQSAYKEAINFQNMISHHSDNLIFVKNERFEIVFANPNFLALYPEAQRDKVLGFTTLEEYEQAEVDIFLENDKHTFEYGYHKCFETISFPNGKIRTVETTKTRFYNNSEVYILGVSVDVTEQQHLINQLETKQLELNQFADLATHDMRKPINSIHQLVDYIIEDNEMTFDFTTHSQLNEIKERCESMSHFLGDLYEYAQIGQEQVQPSTFNVKALVHEMQYLFELPTDMVLTVSDIEVTLPEVPLKMILLQLLTNAVQHYGEKVGRIEVQVNVLKHGTSILVKDHGKGMNDIMQKNAFVLFSSAIRGRDIKGSGKGLAMVKKVVEQYRGSVVLSSQLKKGTEVSIFWPN